MSQGQHLAVTVLSVPNSLSSGPREPPPRLFTTFRGSGFVCTLDGPASGENRSHLRRLRILGCFGPVPIRSSQTGVRVSGFWFRLAGVGRQTFPVATSKLWKGLEGSGRV